MNKIAQRRGLFDKVVEKVRPARITENFFDPDFKQVMDGLRKTDNDIRSIVLGEDVEDGNKGSDELSLKVLLKEAEQNFNRREYMTSISYLGRFHNKLAEIVVVIGNLKTNVDSVHESFLFKDLDDEHKKHLQNLKTRFAGIEKRKQFLKDAGVTDAWHNLFSDRGKALKAWEKRYPKQIGKLKKELGSLLVKSKDVLDSLNSDLKSLNSYRSARKVDDYTRVCDKIKNMYSKYNSSFASFYKDNVKGFLDNQNFTPQPVDTVPPMSSMTPDLSSTLADEPDVGSISVPVPDFKSEPRHDTLPSPTNVSPKSIELAPITKKEINPDEKSDLLYKSMFENGDALKPANLPKEMRNTVVNKPKVPEGLEGIDDSIAPSTIKESDPNKERTTLIGGINNDVFDPKATIRAKHMSFYNSLQSLSNESPVFLANYISKYASKIKSTDLDTSNKLFKIVQEIVG